MEDTLGARQKKKKKSYFWRCSSTYKNIVHSPGPCSENLAIRRKQQLNNCNNNKKSSPSSWGFCSDPMDCSRGLSEAPLVWRGSQELQHVSGRSCSCSAGASPPLFPFTTPNPQSKTPLRSQAEMEERKTGGGEGAWRLFIHSK